MSQTGKCNLRKSLGLGFFFLIFCILYLEMNERSGMCRWRWAPLDSNVNLLQGYFWFVSYFYGAKIIVPSISNLANLAQLLREGGIKSLPQILYPAHYSSNTISLLANGSHNAFEEKLSFSFILGTLSSSGVTRRGVGEGASSPKKVRCLTYKISSTNSLYGGLYNQATCH